MAYVPTTDWGTKKRIARYTVPGTLTTSGTITVNVSAGVPAGTKAVTLRIVVADATVGTICTVSEIGAGAGRWAVGAVAASIANNGNGDIQLDANGAFDIINSAAFDSVQIFVTNVYS